MKKELKKQKIYKGIPASEGIAIGKIFLLERETDLYIPLRKITEDSVKKETHRYKSALELTRKELLSAKDRILKALGKQHALLVEVYVSIIDDQLLTRDVVRMIEEDLVSAEYAVSTALNRVIQTFEKIEDEYFKGRTSDIRDVGRKLLRNILGKERKDLSEIQPEHIVVAHTLSPSDTVTLKEKRCAGFIVDIGSKTSHISLVAQGLQLPAVVGLKTISTVIEDGQNVIIDGFEGTVIIEPSEETINKYTERYNQLLKEKEYLIHLRDLPAKTVDNHQVKLICNLDTHQEIDEAIKSGAEGIGLFRTEYLYIDRDELPSEEELTEIYVFVAKKIFPHSIVFRTMDLGGDKLSRLGLEGIMPEPSPALGLRGIRLSLKYKDIFKTQLRAILRASTEKNVKIMFPLISSVQEFVSAKNIVEEVKSELREKQIDFDEKISVGAMIELPSAALTSDIIAKKADFLSIGTNDLIQYTLAVDRMNENVAEMYEPLHLSVLRLIKQIIEAGHSKGKLVAMCGEMASDITFTKILLGLGLDEFSVPPALVLKLKKLIRSFSLSDARNLVKEVFETEEYGALLKLFKTG